MVLYHVSTTYQLLYCITHRLSRHPREGAGLLLVEYIFPEARRKETVDEATGKKKRSETLIFPRYHQLDLIRKLLATQSRSFEKQFHESVHLENRRKINSPALLQNIETLLSAIQQRKAVTFAYLHYDLRKQLVPKRQKPYHVYPYFMVMENDNVYLLCKSPSHPEHFAHYRVDKITDIDMTAETIPPLDDDMDPYTYTAQRKFMYSDAVDTITLRCHLRMLDDLIDQFGSALSLAPADDEHFLAHLHASRQGIVYLALQYARYCEILQPADLRQEVISILQDTLKRYEIE